MKINELIFEAPPVVAAPAAPAAAPAAPQQAAAPAAKPVGIVDKAVGGMAKVAGGINKATSAVQKGFTAYKNLGKDPKATATPFDDVNPSTMAKAIDKILAGQALDPAEIAELKELRGKL